MEKWSNFHATGEKKNIFCVLALKIFFFPVNFNKDNDALIHKFREAVDALVTPDYLFTWLKHFNGRWQEEFEADTMLDVYSVRIRAAFEHEGKRNHGLHCHLLIEVGHSTSVQIAQKGFCDVFRAIVGENPNCKIRFVKGVGEDKDFILHYLTKEVPAYKPESLLNAHLKTAFSGKNEEMEVEAEL